MTFTSDTATHSSDPTAQLRWVHLVLTTQLNLPSPLDNAVALLDRLQAVNMARSAGAQAVARDREALARAIATGEREFDAKALREWAAGGLWGGGRRGAAGEPLARQRRGARSADRGGPEVPGGRRGDLQHRAGGGS
jgi:hypothetical protein